MKTGTVVGTFLDTEGLPLVGRVFFTPYVQAAILDTSNNTTIIPNPTVVTLDGTGSFSVDLVATDDPDLNPTGWTYGVRVKSKEGTTGFAIHVPADVTTNLNTVIPVTDDTGTATVVGPAGPPGPPGSGGALPVGGTSGQVLRKQSVTDGDALWSDDRVQLKGTENISIGTSNTLASLTTGVENVALGHGVLEFATSGTGNMGIGIFALNKMIDGHSNVGVGRTAGWSMTSAHSNIALGRSALYYMTTGTENVAVGRNAAAIPNGNSANASVTATAQTVVGHAAGQSSATQADGLTAVGHTARGTTNSTALGARAQASHSASVALGADTSTTATSQVMVGARDVEITDAARGVILKSPDGTRYRITVANGGSLTVAAV